MPTLLDAVALAPAAILGLIGIWLGFGRSLVAWPMRWLIPLLGACFVALPATLYLGRMAAVLSSSDMVAAAATAAVSFAATLVLLLMFMRNLRERMAVWTASRRAGLAERLVGGAFGFALGVLLVALVYVPVPRVVGSEPAWARGSVLLGYFRAAADAMETALSPYLPLR